MCTIIKRQKAAFAYLEEVRKHLSRLPALDPHTRTLLVTGYPNVGKSSFMNKVTRANVDVQPYAFTTKSLFVGHMDHRYLRWQVIDTPGILDHPLEQRNTIEMQSVTALAHLQCAVLYFIDISEQCGYTVEQQVSLFKSIKPLFANKQLVIVVNKVDQQPWDTLDPSKKSSIEELGKASNCEVKTMSNVTDHGVMDVKSLACDKLLQSRVDQRVVGKKVNDVMNRLQVFQPQQRDGEVREAFIPESVKEAKKRGEIGGRDHVAKKSRSGFASTKDDQQVEGGDDMDTSKPVRKTERDLMWENGGPGVYSMDYRKNYMLDDDSHKFDAIPEIMDGKNIADYIDPDIDAKLAALEEEEDARIAEKEAAGMGEEEERDLDSDEEAIVKAVREKKTIARNKKQEGRKNTSVLPRSVRLRKKDKHDKSALDKGNVRSHLEGLGVDADGIVERGRERGRKRSRRDGDEEIMDVEPVDTSGMSNKELKRHKREEKSRERRSVSVARSHSKVREPSQVGLRDDDMKKIATKKDMLSKRRFEGMSGEGDQRKTVHLVKWMNTGKKRNGTHNKR